jgi:hypothetical protein
MRDRRRHPEQIAAVAAAGKPGEAAHYFLARGVSLSMAALSSSSKFRRSRTT